VYQIGLLCISCVALRSFFANFVTRAAGFHIILRTAKVVSLDRAARYRSTMFYNVQRFGTNSGTS
jgi:hypothetical protein